jgi:hypothetical protein
LVLKRLGRRAEALRDLEQYLDRKPEYVSSGEERTVVALLRALKKK